MHAIVRWSGVLAALLLSVSPAQAGRKPRPRPSKAPLAFAVIHLPTQPCGGLCGLRRGQVNRFRFVLKNVSGRPLRVAWQYSCSGYSPLSLQLLAGPSKRPRIHARKSFGRNRVCTRNGPLLERLTPGAALLVELPWKLPRKLLVGLLRLRARAEVMVYAGPSLASKTVSLEARQHIPVH